MTGRPSAAVERAMKLVAKGWTAYAAAKHVGIALSTIYRSKLYREWKNEKDQKPGGK